MQTISRYFGLLLLLSCLTGLIVPSAGSATSLIVILSLAFIIFCSFFQINFSVSAFNTDLGLSVKFWAARYLLIPVGAYLFTAWINEFYAVILLLTLILPAAVSSPAFSAIYKGKPDLSLKILVFSSFLAVLTIPFLMSLLVGSSIEINTGEMLMTLFYTIVVPFILHLPLRSMIRFKNTISRYNALFTLIGLSIIFIVVTARNKYAILEDPGQVSLYALASLVLYLIMYLLGYFLLPSQNKENRRTLSISSGANNIGLGVTITALYFPGDMNIFFIVSQLMWVVMLIPLRRIFNR